MSENKSSSQFNAYEYIGVIAPGAVLSLGIILIWPQTKEVFFNNNVSIGELGLFIIIAYVIGHLLQSVGNVLEKVLWKGFGGMPTDWVRHEEQTLISTQQRMKFLSIIQQKQNIHNLENLDSRKWYSVIREIYIDVEKDGRSNRIDSFNRTYGLLRGIAASFFVLSVIIPIHNLVNWDVALWILGLGFIPALFRMFRFGKSYGRELIVEYIKLNNNSI